MKIEIDTDNLSRQTMEDMLENMTSSFTYVEDNVRFLQSQVKELSAKLEDEKSQQPVNRDSLFSSAFFNKPIEGMMPVYGVLADCGFKIPAIKGYREHMMLTGCRPSLKESKEAVEKYMKK